MFGNVLSKLEEDTQLAIALSTSVEDRRKSLADFVSYTLPVVVNKPEEEVTESSPLIDATFNPLKHSSKDAFLLLMSQKTKESSLSTILGKKYKVLVNFTVYVLWFFFVHKY